MSCTLATVPTAISIRRPSLDTRPPRFPLIVFRKLSPTVRLSSPLNEERLTSLCCLHWWKISLLVVARPRSHETFTKF